MPALIDSSVESVESVDPVYRFLPRAGGKSTDDTDEHGLLNRNRSGLACLDRFIRGIRGIRGPCLQIFVPGLEKKRLTFL